jgi:hypothetical protein
MPDSPLKPQAPSTRDPAQHLADSRTWAREALVDPDFTPAALPDGVLLELITLAYRGRQADRLRETADELLRRLDSGAPVTLMNSRMHDPAAGLEAVEAHLAVMEGAVRAPTTLPDPTDTTSDSARDSSLCMTMPDEGAPEERSTREAVHDVLMTALEISLSVGRP